MQAVFSQNTEKKSFANHNHCLRETSYKKQQAANLTHNDYKINVVCPINAVCKSIIFGRVPVLSEEKEHSMEK